MTHPSDGGGFVQALLAAAGQGDARAQVERVLRMWAGQRVYIPVAALVRGQTARQAAIEIVRAGVGTRAAQAMLVQRFGLSARHARRLVRAGVDVRGHAMSANLLTLLCYEQPQRRLEK